jgi:hypothetical protein
VCRDALGDSPARPGVSRRLTLRGVLAAAGDGVATGDAFAVALRRVGIVASGEGNWMILWGWERTLGRNVGCGWRGTETGGEEKGGRGRGGVRSRAERQRVFGFARERESTDVLWPLGPG